jgi:hypothetical protein
MVPTSVSYYHQSVSGSVLMYCGIPPRRNRCCECFAVVPVSGPFLLVTSLTEHMQSGLVPCLSMNSSSRLITNTTSSGGVYSAYRLACSICERYCGFYRKPNKSFIKWLFLIIRYFSIGSQMYARRIYPFINLNIFYFFVHLGACRQCLVASP